MKTIDLWQWMLSDPIRPGRRFRSRWHMTEADAMREDPTATRVECSHEARLVPESPDEFVHTDRFCMGKPAGC